MITLIADIFKMLRLRRKGAELPINMMLLLLIGVIVIAIVALLFLGFKGKLGGMVNSSIPSFG